MQIFAHLQDGQYHFADTGSILDLHIQYEVLSMRDIVEEDTWSLYVYKNVCSIVQSVFSFCTNGINIFAE